MGRLVRLQRQRRGTGTFTLEAQAPPCGRAALWGSHDDVGKAWGTDHDSLYTHLYLVSRHRKFTFKYSKVCQRKRGRGPGGPAEPRGRDRERQANLQGKVSFVEIIFFFFLLRQGLACLSLLSDGVTGTGRHAWFTHMILNRLKTKQNEVEIGEFSL